MRRRKDIHLPSFEYVGERRYTFTLCTHDRLRAFDEGAAVTESLSSFLRAADRHDMALAAYCFMPDHVHLLALGLASTSDAMRFIAMAKQLSGYRYARTRSARLWQRYVWDRVLRSQEDTLTVIRYILENPVRAGLVERALDYPYSGSAMWSRDELAEILWAG